MGKPKSPNKNITLNKTINKRLDSNIPVTNEMIKIKARGYYEPLCNINHARL